MHTNITCKKTHENKLTSHLGFKHTIPYIYTKSIWRAVFHSTIKIHFWSQMWVVSAVDPVAGKLTFAAEQMWWCSFWSVLSKLLAWSPDLRFWTCCTWYRYALLLQHSPHSCCGKWWCLEVFYIPMRQLYHTFRKFSSSTISHYTRCSAEVQMLGNELLLSNLWRNVANNFQSRIFWFRNRGWYSALAIYLLPPQNP
jgi:hypothetical protein